MTDTAKADTLGRLHGAAIALDRAGETARAEHALRSILALDPLFPPAVTSLCGRLAHDGRRQEALGLVERAIAQRPGAAVFHRNAAELLRQLARYDEALGAADRAVAADPQDYQALMIRSTVHHDRHDFRCSAADSRRAIALQPDFAEPHLRLGELHLMHGEFAEGWAEYDWNGRVSMARRLLPEQLLALDRQRWHGEPLGDRSLLLVADQGFGDALQFARYLPWAAGRSGDVIVACPGTLLSLLQQILPAARFFPDWTGMPEFAAWSPLSSLPRLHGTTADTIPPAPRLVPPAGAAATWIARLAGICPPGARRIGVVWAGRASHPNDVNRSASMAALAPIAACPGVFLVSLQQDPARQEIADYDGAAPLLDAGPLLETFSDTAGLLSALDLVITIDSAVAHLAGSMGKPAWVMIADVPDWRWMLGRADSPWYPSLRLFRAPAPRAWGAVAAAMAEALQ